MKYLRITNTPDGIRLARCLIGSMTKSNRVLSGVSETEGEKFFIAWEDSYGACWINSVLLPLDTIKLDPFAAMREGISVRAMYHGSFCYYDGSDDPSMQLIGTIKMSEICGEQVVFKIRDYKTGEDGEFYSKEITIDLTAIERGELDGVSIVEVVE